MEDIRLAEKVPGGIVIRLPESKTNQHGELEEIPIRPNEDKGLCPVAALVEWFEVARIGDKGPVFVSTKTGVGQEHLTPEEWWL